MKNITVHGSLELSDRLTALASKSGMSRSEYCATILESVAQSGLVFREERSLHLMREDAPQYRVSSALDTDKADARAASGLAGSVLKALSLKPPTGAPTGETSSPSSGERKHPNPRPKPPIPAPK